MATSSQQPDSFRRPPGHSGPDGSAASWAQDAPAIVEAMDRLSQHLSLAGIGLVSLSRRLEDAEDRLLLCQASDELDAAVAEVRRLALTTRQHSGS